MWPLLRVILLPDTDDLEDEIWNLQVMLEWVKTLGDVGIGQRHFAGGTGGQIFTTW